MFNKKNILTIFMICSSVALFGESKSSDMLKEIDKYREYNNKGYSFIFTTETQEESTVLKVYAKGYDKAVIKYIEPVESREQFILKSGKSYWLIESGMNAPIRLSPRTMLFGTASSGDITSTSFSRQYKITESKITAEGTFLSLKAIKKKGATYENIELYVDSETLKPIEAKCFSRAGILLKTVSYSTYTNINNKEILTGFKIKDEVNDIISLISIKDFKDEVLQNRHYKRDYMKNLKPEQ